MPTRQAKAQPTCASAHEIVRSKKPTAGLIFFPSISSSEKIHAF
ncbi:hypothetical protein JOE48_000341 [Methylobacterium sp. PvR107]|nr:hypothetical protein [Methylobacterium sp. PvR107]